MVRLVLGLLAGGTLLGCAGSPSVPGTYESCAASPQCTITGLATAQVAHHAWMAKLELGDGRCVDVSLPPARLEQLKRGGPSQMTVKGYVYGYPSDNGGEEVVVMEIEGRKIGFGQCADFFVFVED